jgi:acyl-coenzyme A thioesterase PaaI-like protein
MARAEELQHAAATEFWERFEAVMGGPDGLMTYRYLGTQADLESGGRAGGMNIRRDMRYPGGGLMAAPLSIALADAGGVHGDAVSVPAPVLTTVHLVDDGKDVKAVRVLAGDTPGHRGRQLSFGGTSLVVDADDSGRVLAVTQDIGVSMGEIPEAARGGYRYVDPGPGMPDSPDLPPLHEAFGATRDHGNWQLPVLSQRIGSTSGSLHHGPIQILLEAVGFELATSAAGSDLLAIEDWTVTYTSRGKVGPFRAAGSILSGNLGRYVARVHLTDGGNEDRLVATALAVFRRDGSPR